MNMEFEIRRNPPAIMTVVEASMYLQQSDRKVRELVKSGELRHSRQSHKIMIRKEWADEFINRHQRGGQNAK